MKLHAPSRLLAALPLLLLLAGCPQRGPLENAGESIDEAFDDVRDGVEDAIDDVGDEIEDAQRR